MRKNVRGYGYWSTGPCASAFAGKRKHAARDAGLSWSTGTLGTFDTARAARPALTGAANIGVGGGKEMRPSPSAEQCVA